MAAARPFARGCSPLRRVAAAAAAWILTTGLRSNNAVVGAAVLPQPSQATPLGQLPLARGPTTHQLVHSGTPAGIDPSTDCAIRKLAWRYGKRLKPSRGGFRPLFDALQVSRPAVLYGLCGIGILVLP